MHPIEKFHANNTVLILFLPLDLEEIDYLFLGEKFELGKGAADKFFDILIFFASLVLIKR